MGFPAFDSHKFVKKFTASGFHESQSEVLVELVLESQHHNIDALATKEQISNIEDNLKKDIQILRKDIQTVENTLKKDIQTVENTLKKDIQTVENTLKKDIQTVENTLKKDIQTVEENLKLSIETSTSKTKNTILMWMMPFLATNMVAVIGLLVAIFIK